MCEDLAPYVFLSAEEPCKIIEEQAQFGVPQFRKCHSIDLTKRKPLCNHELDFVDLFRLLKERNKLRDLYEEED